MTAITRRSVALGAAAVALVLAAAAQVFACASLATLNLSAAAGPAGARVTATGAGYRTTGGLPVVLVWNATWGPELARTTPNAKGEISLTFTVPAGTPGYYVVIAVQRDAAGVDSYGTPSRASFEIVDGSPAPTTTLAAPPTTRRPTTTATIRRTTTVPPTSVVSTTTAAAPPPTVATAAGSTEASVAVQPLAARADQPDEAPSPGIVAIAGVLLAAVALGVSRAAYRGPSR